VNYLQQLVGTVAPSDPTEFGYPAGASVLQLGNEAGKFHVIFGAAADTMTSAGLNALYANAPNGSLYICMDGATTKKIAIKFGNVGLKDGSFLFSAALASV